ncbi:MAG TPA: PQQ-binding-like beta-propeller repeat protein [Bryobacteraceae bacterium]|jgi:alcohol dehydrogenase (cytochrome c)
MNRLVLFTAAVVASAQVQNFKPVTTDMLVNPSPNDWLMYSRTYDAQRYSPLKQIDTRNVGQLRLAWTRGLASGETESIPLVYNGVMYAVIPGAAVQALDATSGDLLWEYKRKVPPNVAASARTKNLAIYDDIVVYTAPDSYVVGLDARTGEQRWETKAEESGHTSGPLVVEGKAITGRACSGKWENCFIAAHDVKTGKELWRFHTTPRPGEPGDETWAGADLQKRLASVWGLPGSYDPVRKVLYWGVSNPMPNTRADRHNGNPDAISRSAPADLYSNSTLALNPDTGKLLWYYQHLPGDDWDEDYTHERTLLRTRVNPDPKYVKWINPDVPKGQERDMAVMVGEGGGVFALDRSNGQFLWATPFPYDTKEFLISNIDVKTGKTYINWDDVLKQPGERHVICFWNTRSYWPTAYSPVTNSLYVAYNDNCLDMTRANPATKQNERRVGIQRPGGNPDEFGGIGKINLSTGEILRFDLQRSPGTGAVLATAGGLIFHGDVNRRLRAFDSANGKLLWEQILGGPISVSTITYAVNGKQYVSVITGDNLANGGLARQAGMKTVTGHNAIYTFALP